jgi:hypothetical protein
MVSTVHGVNRHIIKMAVAVQPAQAAFAHLILNCQKIFIIKIKCGMKLSLTILAGGKNTISYQNVVVDMGIKISAEAVDKSNGPKSGASRGSRTALPNRGFYRAQENTEQTTDHFGLGFHMPSDSLRHRQNPLPKLHAGQDIIDHVSGSLHHPASGA